MLQEKSLYLTKKLLACQKNTLLAKKRPSSLFLDLLLNICILAAELRCTFLMVGQLIQANKRGLSATASLVSLSVALKLFSTSLPMNSTKANRTGRQLDIVQEPLGLREFSLDKEGEHAGVTSSVLTHGQLVVGVRREQGVVHARHAGVAREELRQGQGGPVVLIHPDLQIEKGKNICLLFVHFFTGLMFMCWSKHTQHPTSLVTLLFVL